MFWRLWSGKAKLQLLLKDDCFRQGEQLQGELCIYGGIQHVRHIRVYVCLTMITMKGREYTRELMPLLDIDVLHIHQGEEQRLPFSCDLPRSIPVSSTQMIYTIYLEAEPGYQEMKQIEIMPAEPLQNVMDAFEDLDFQRIPTSGMFNGKEQSFVFKPIGYFISVLSKADFIAAFHEKDIFLLLHIVCKEHKDLYRLVKFVPWEWEDKELLTEKLRRELTDMCNEPFQYSDSKRLEGEVVGTYAAQLFPPAAFTE
jgi:sporulation-control protein spo0M